MRFAFAASLLMLVSGCMDGDGPPNGTEDSTATTSTNLNVGANLPEWNLGQGWTYAVERPGEATETFKMMVAEDRDDLWVVASNDRDQAVNHAVYSTNPMLGRIGKGTLSPFQGGEPVKMYQFPITDGQTWSATFFGTTMNFHAEYVGDIDTTAINAARNLPKKIDGFRITATGGGMRIDYDYVEAVEWFTSFQILEDTGAKSLKLTLKDFEASYHGNYYFYRGAKDSDSLIKDKTAANANPGTTETYEASVPEAFKDFVALGVVYVGKTGNFPPQLTLTLKKPDGSTALTQQFTGAREIHYLQDTTGQAGKWSLQADFTGSLDFHARVFGISKYAEGSI